jgi:NTE family protein
MRIQLAIQGGGARLVALLAAAQAFQSLHKRGDIEITRIAGTSAGSVVGALIAGKQDIDDVHLALLGKRQDYWEALFPTMGLPTILYRLGRNQPLYDLDQLRVLLRLFFADGDTFDTLLGHSRIHVTVLVANLTSVVPDLRTGTANVIDSLLDSCALPFILRSSNTQGYNVHVDGGIVANLPSEHLSDPKEFGPIIGLSFPRATREPPRDRFTYAYRLLDAAMEASMERARRQIGKDLLYEVKTKIGTFDFSKVHDCLENEYKPIVSDSTAWLIRRIEILKQQVDDVDPWAEVPDLVLTELGKLYEELDGDKPLRFEQRKLEVTANSLSRHPSRKLLPDGVTETVKFGAADHHVHCYRFVTASSGGKGVNPRTKVKVWGPNDEPVAHKLLPVKAPNRSDDGLSRRGIVIFFAPPLPPKSGPYTIRFQEQLVEGMGPLRETGNDENWFLQSRPSLSEYENELILYVPDEFPEIEQAGAKESIPGTAMSAAELDENTPAGFRAYGWRGKVKDVGDRFGVRYRLEK